MQVNIIDPTLIVTPETNDDSIFMMLCRIHLPFTVEYDPNFHNEELNKYGAYRYTLKLKGDKPCK